MTVVIQSSNTRTAQENAFFSQLREEPATGCLLWTGRRHPFNITYGRVFHDGVWQYAHRLAFTLHHGRVPKGFISQSCGRALCCNPAHLLEGEQPKGKAKWVEKGDPSLKRSAAWKKYLNGEI